MQPSTEMHLVDATSLAVLTYSLLLIFRWGDFFSEAAAVVLSRKAHFRKGERKKKGVFRNNIC